MAEHETTPSSPLLEAMQQQELPPPISAGGKVMGTALAITNIAIGSVYLGQCPKQYLIPYFLIVSGSGNLLYLTLTCLPCGDGREPPRTSLPIVFVRGLLLLFLFAYFIAGNVWIYSIYLPDFEHPASPEYCHRVLYLYAFWILTLHYILIGIMLAIAACLYICFYALRAHI